MAKMNRLPCLWLLVVSSQGESQQEIRQEEVKSGRFSPSVFPVRPSGLTVSLD